MEPQVHSIYHLVKSEDLNHHGTLYAGRTAEWFVDAGFIAAALLTKPENIVCLKIHGMSFTAPVKKGEIVKFDSRIVYAGKTSLVAYISINNTQGTILKGFITFVHVDLNGKSTPHGIAINPLTPEDQELYQQAKTLPR